jgi:hypothetical protein
MEGVCVCVCVCVYIIYIYVCVCVCTYQCLFGGVSLGGVQAEELGDEVLCLGGDMVPVYMCVCVCVCVC